MSAKLDGLVEKTYQALLSVVQTTAVSRRVLQRPPFTFLHKLLVETLEQYDIFSAQQLEFAELVSKEDKAAFLTRALAFVSFAMANFKEKTISVLLLVSPVKVLAGVSVEDTHEFLQQLCVVCKSPNTEAKESAAREVLAKGDAQLYTTGVTFRRGLVLIQAIIRAFISRRVGKRKACVAANASVGLTKTPQSQHGFYSGTLQPMTVGTKFLKELPNGRVYDGVIAGVRGKRYTLRYEQDSEAEDDVDEIEMKILLEESVRLYRLRERIRSPRKEEDAEISLTSLPDLTPVAGEDGVRPRIAKRHSSSREFERLISQATASVRPALSRSMSSRQSVGSSPTKFDDSDANDPNRRSASGGRVKLERITSQLFEDEDRSKREPDSSDTISDESKRDDAPQSSEEKPWQSSLKQLLAKGQADTRSEVSVRVVDQGKKHSGNTGDTQPTCNNATSRMSFPELTIPGKRKLPAVQKRKQPTAGFKPPGAGSKPLPKSKLAESLETNHGKPNYSPLNGAYDTSRGGGGGGTSTISASSTRIQPMSSGNDGVVDLAFGGAYQSTDQKTQEKLALFREIVHRIDGYMKRKRLRVIDLFRFCDADGNGSISPQEMIDTLSQMEIQLSPEQGHEFIDYIDKDGNGSIDIDEFEELLRVARRSEAQREQLKRELQNGKKAGGDHAVKPATNRYAPLIKHRLRILDELKSLDLGDVGAVSTSQAKSMLIRLQLPGIDESAVNELLERSKLQLSTAEASGSLSATPAMEQASIADATIYLQHIAKALSDLEWSKKANRFLDQSWLAQFDSQLERAFREYELL